MGAPKHGAWRAPAGAGALDQAARRTSRKRLVSAGTGVCAPSRPVASLVVWFLYGSMVWGVFPLAPRMSWELHATGLVLGLVLAWAYRDWDRPPLKTYEWEDEDDQEQEQASRAPEDDDDEPWRSQRWH